jgi:hypothetical protein
MADMSRKKAYLLLTDPFQETTCTPSIETLGKLYTPRLTPLSGTPMAQYYPKKILIRQFIDKVCFRLIELDEIHVEYSILGGKIYIHDNKLFPEDIAYKGILLDTYLFLIFHLTNEEELYIVLCKFPELNEISITTLSDKLRITDTCWIMDEKNNTFKPKHAEIKYYLE